MRKTAVMILALAFAISLVGCSADTISGVENYDKAHYVSVYKGDLDSDLSVFPDRVTNVSDSDFLSSMSVNLFDTDGYIILVSKLSPREIAAEVERLQGLSMTIRDSDGATYTNNILYDEESYHYPAYVANDGFGHTHEYALIDEAGGRIIYVYTAYIDPNKFEYQEYLKKDLSAYEKDSTDSFTMYNHTFDGGQSWVEFDDAVSETDVKE